MTTKTLYMLCEEVNNWFVKKKSIGNITIANGALDLDTSGYNYIRIMDSLHNDGLHEVGNMTLTDETFDGAVWFLKIQKPFLDLAGDVEQWVTENAGKDLYQSESFGGYSYSRNPNSLSWQGFYKARLDAWRKKR